MGTDTGGKDHEASVGPRPLCPPKKRESGRGSEKRRTNETGGNAVELKVEEEDGVGYRASAHQGDVQPGSHRGGGEIAVAREDCKSLPLQVGPPHDHWQLANDGRKTGVCGAHIL